VIIGIILGAVLKGQEIIDTAKVKRIQNDLKGLETMMWTYFDRKRNFPGDCNQDGLIRFDAPNDATGVTPSNNIDPTFDYCASSATIETDVNRAFSDMRVARIAPYAQPNVLLAKHTNNDYFHIGFFSVGGVNYNAIFIYGIPAWMAKMIDVSIDGIEDGTTGRVRRHDTADGGAAWPANIANNTPVAIEYFFDRTP
jgi:hypothetical protein